MIIESRNAVFFEDIFSQKWEEEKTFGNRTHETGSGTRTQWTNS